MGEHRKHDMHDHSIKSYHEMMEILKGRDREIYETVWRAGASTDRQLMAIMGHSEPNAVRPNITRMIQKKILSEIRATKCEITGKTVRVVDIATPAGDDERQGVLF